MALRLVMTVAAMQSGRSKPAAAVIANTGATTGTKPSAAIRSAVCDAPGSGLVTNIRFERAARVKQPPVGEIRTVRMRSYPPFQCSDTGEVDRLPWQAEMGQDSVRGDAEDTMKPVLGIETSCDETAAAVVDGDGRIRAEAVLSQLSEHAAFGGVVPEIAARTHLRYLSDQVRQTMSKAGVAYQQLGGVAASSGPGLIGGLIVGCQFGKGVAIANRLPFVAVNHLEAHALTARLPGLVEDGAPFPYLLFLLSGGHSQCIAVTDVGKHIRLGGTVDDAVGEAFDKVAKLLGLDWPGGPALEKLAEEGDSGRFPFPRPMLRRPGCNLSLSGLKTAVAQTVLTLGSSSLTREQCADIAASFQQAVVDVLADRASHAIDMMRDQLPGSNLLVVAGGVASNARVRTALSEVARSRGFRMVAPPIRLCSDNAVMVAWVGVERLRRGLNDDMNVDAQPRWPLEALQALEALEALES